MNTELFTKNLFNKLEVLLGEKIGSLKLLNF